MSSRALFRTTKSTLLAPTREYASRFVPIDRILRVRFQAAKLGYTATVPATTVVTFLPHGHATRTQTRSASKRAITLGRASAFGGIEAITSVQIKKVLVASGWTITQIDNLVNAIHLRAPQADGARFIAESLKNRESWLQDDSLVPGPYRRAWLYPNIGPLYRKHLEAIGHHTDEEMMSACRILGIDALKIHEDFPTEHSRIHYMGLFMLEIAVMFGDSVAATCLIKYCADPLKAESLADGRSFVSLTEAERLVKDLATNNPSLATWQVIVTYMGDEYGPRKIKRQSPTQLKWAVEVLLQAASRTPDEWGFNENATPLIVTNYTHPCKLMLYILDYCLHHRISIPDYPDLHELRVRTLTRLVGVSDPVACMTLALAEDGLDHGSDEWLGLLTVAAADENADACWLLAIAYLRKERLLPSKTNPEGELLDWPVVETPHLSWLDRVRRMSSLTSADRVKAALFRTHGDYSEFITNLNKTIELDHAKSRLDTSLGAEFARLSLLLSASQPRALLPRSWALAALFRMHGNYSEGVKVLGETLRLAYTVPDFDRKLLNQMEGTFVDYTTKDQEWEAYWTEKKMNNLIREVFEPQHWVQDARANLAKEVRESVAGNHLPR